MKNFYYITLVAILLFGLSSCTSESIQDENEEINTDVVLIDKDDAESPGSR